MNAAQEKTLNKILTKAHNDHERELNAHAFFKTNNHSVSNDLVQITFMKTWNYLVKGGKIEMMRSFLYHILNNLIIDEYRKHKTTSLDMMLENDFELSTDGDFKHLCDILDGKKALLLIKKIPLKYKKVIQMRYIKEMSLEEISSIIGTSRKTISVQVHRGIKKLKSLYKKTYI